MSVIYIKVSAEMIVTSSCVARGTMVAEQQQQFASLFTEDKC